MKNKIYIPSCDFRYPANIYSYDVDSEGTQYNLSNQAPARQKEIDIYLATEPRISFYKYNQKDNSTELIMFCKETDFFKEARDELSNYELQMSHDSLAGLYNIMVVSFIMNDIYSVLELKRKK